MHKVSYLLAARFSQDSLETLFGTQYSSGAYKDSLFPYDLGFDNSIRNQKVFEPIAAVSVRDEI